ncbi:MAG TPA: hypothetical protein VK073_01495 [Pseudogracilibacillus sp.]|nr:hypothetical protein [Pseudogracilibacillus sp.]
MAEKEEKTSIKKYIIFFIVAFIFYSLFNTFIWEKYFYTPTAFDALESEKGGPGVFHEIDNKNEIAILTPEDAFHVYTLSKKLMGWEIEDEISLPAEEDSDADTPYTIHRENMALHKNKEVDTLMVVTRDPEIWYVRLIDEEGAEHGTNGTKVGDEYSLHYMWDTDAFDEDLTIKMYSYEDELLYTE